MQRHMQLAAYNVVTAKGYHKHVIALSRSNTITVTRHTVAFIRESGYIVKAYSEVCFNPTVLWQQAAAHVTCARDAICVQHCECLFEQYMCVCTQDTPDINTMNP